MTLQEVLNKTIQFFKEKKIESARLDAEILISSALGLKRIDLYLKFDQPLGEAELDKCRDWVRRRSLGEPVAYILGQKEFFGQNFIVNKDVLIPRPETEILVEVALDWINKKSSDNFELLDLGCGSGCIGLTLSKKCKEKDIKLKATLLDISEAALIVAKQNCEKLNLVGNVDFVLADARNYDDLERDKKFDLILANPPYIANNDERVQESVKKFEPHLALFAENQGLAKIKDWSRTAQRLLKPNGFLGLEIGMGQAQEVIEYLSNIGFDQIQIRLDLAGVERHITAQRSS